MAAVPAKLGGAWRWLSATGKANRLDGEVAVVSTHLDDAVLSLGAAIAHAVRRGASVSVVTVLAGDPNSSAPAGEWDSQAGFRTQGEATQARRDEDRRACERVGAQPVWLPFSDHQYERRGDDAAILAALVAAVGRAETVLLPGFPLMHPDHAWVVGLHPERQIDARFGFYVEQPYAALWTAGPPAQRAWTPLAASLPDRLRKIRACRAYSTQLPLLAEKVMYRVTRYEARRGGEAVAWTREDDA